MLVVVISELVDVAQGARYHTVSPEPYGTMRVL